jgi:hypothetical protein
MEIPPILTHALIGVAVIFLMARLFHRTERLIWMIQWTVTLSLSYLLAILIASQLKRPTVETLLWGFIAMLLADRQFPSRSRFVRKTVRRDVIARYERRTGQRYDPSLHELDHIIPHAKGGDNAGYNLRVTTKKENRSKGKKSPRWDLLGRWRD